MASETFDEQLTRFDLMCEGDPTWDLSDNDIAALLAVRTELRIIAAGNGLLTERVRELEAALRAFVKQGEPVRGGSELWSSWQERVKAWKQARAALESEGA